MLITIPQKTKGESSNRFFLSDQQSKNPKTLHFLSIKDKEKQQVLTFKKLFAWKMTETMIKINGIKAAFDRLMIAARVYNQMCYFLKLPWLSWCHELFVSTLFLAVIAVEPCWWLVT